MRENREHTHFESTKERRVLHGLSRSENTQKEKMDQQGNSGSARSARKRIQVGATNRSFASSNAASPLSAAAEKGSGVSGGRSNAQNGNTSHHLREGRATSVGNLQRPGSAATNSATIQKRHAASHQVSALALSDRSADKVRRFGKKQKSGPCMPPRTFKNSSNPR